MAVKKYKPTSAARRFITTADFSEITKKAPEKSLLEVRQKHSGRNLQRVGITHTGALDVKDVVGYARLVLTTAAHDALAGAFAQESK